MGAARGPLPRCRTAEDTEKFASLHFSKTPAPVGVGAKKSSKVLEGQSKVLEGQSGADELKSNIQVL
jgi:hypothetical protein